MAGKTTGKASTKAKGKSPQRALIEWQKALRLQDWDITYQFLPEAQYNQDLRDRGQDESYCGTQGVNFIRRRLLKSHIMVSSTAGEPEETLVHELVHLILEPLREEANKSAEQLEGVAKSMCKGDINHALEIATETLARAFINVRDIAQK